MSDSTLLYIGMFCFALMVTGMVLTMLEFRNMRASRVKGVETGTVAALPRTVASVSKSRVR